MGWGAQEVIAYTSDISMSGVFVETNRCLPVGTEVRLDFQLVNRGNSLPVSVQGTVARRVFTQRKDDPKHLVGIGVEFQKFLTGQELLREVLSTLRGTAPAKDEQRRSARIPVSIPITWGTSDACELAGHFSDISLDGSFIIHTNTPNSPGTRLYLRFEIPHLGRFREVKAVATVVRMVAEDDASPGGMAVIFELSTVDVDYLHSFITRRLPRDQTPGAPMSAESKSQLTSRLSNMAARARASVKRTRNPGGHQIRLKWIAKALCYSLPVIFVFALLMLC